MIGAVAMTVVEEILVEVAWVVEEFEVEVEVEAVEEVWVMVELEEVAVEEALVMEALEEVVTRAVTMAVESMSGGGVGSSWC